MNTIPELNVEALDNYIMGTNDVNAPFNQPELEFVSDCCGAFEVGSLDNYEKNKPLGMCSDCTEMTTFHLESDEDAGEDI